MEELILKLTRLKEIDLEISSIRSNRKAMRDLEKGFIEERKAVLIELRKGGVSIARVRGEKKEKKEKKS